MFCFHKYSEEKDHYQYCTKCNKKKLVECDHVWSDVKEKYQHCSKCNMARYFPCGHKWKIVQAFTNEGYATASGIIHILQCVNCGEITKRTSYV